MNMVIHDLTAAEYEGLDLGMAGAKIIGIGGDESVKCCIGCFGCWIKTPGECVIKDRLQDMGRDLGRCEKLLIISRCTYGGYSPSVKNVLDRSIPYLHPDFQYVDGEMHHQMRYDNRIELTVAFYGHGVTEGEKETARKLVAANAVNLSAEVKAILFAGDTKELGEMLG